MPNILHDFEQTRHGQLVNLSSFVIFCFNGCIHAVIDSPPCISILGTLLFIFVS